MQVAERILSFARPEPGVFIECLLMTIDVRDATLGDIAGCHRCLDEVAQEGRWLSRLSAPPFDGFAAYMTDLYRARAPQIVAVDDHVVGWCDIRLDASPVRAHVGTLGMGLLATYRGNGIGGRLLRLAMQRAREADWNASSFPSFMRTPLPGRFTRSLTSRSKAVVFAAGNTTVFTRTAFSWLCLQLTSKHSAAQVAFSSRPPDGTVCRKPEPKRSGRAGNGRSSKCAAAHKGWIASAP